MTAPLPIDSFLPQIQAELRQHKRLVLVAQPGAGKTTRVPPFLLKNALLSGANDRIIMLQPRRVAARSAAARIAFENRWQLGREVGYQVRGERRIAADTRLQIMTEGILTRKLIEDPFLEGIGCVILDEFHERHIDSDLCIAMLREVCSTVRDDLYIVVMSATLEAETVAGFLGDCPIIEVPGKLYPVDISFAPIPPSVRPISLPQHIATLVRRVLDGDEDPGDILVFLPGIEEIRRTMRELEPLASSRDLAILPLHGSLPFDAQARVLEQMPQRKVILSTNIAETSLTIDGVRTVIDSGLARVPSYDPRRGMDRLELKRVSRASATQRAGRAGRTAPGQCIRLWSAAEDKNLKPFELPEVHRIDLCSAILHLHEWGKSDPRQFAWLEPPPEHMIASAERTLEMLGAIKDGGITPLGREMLAIPAHPRLARLIIETRRRPALLHAGASMAALFSEKDIMLPPDPAGPRAPSVVGRSDVLLRLELLEHAEKVNFAGHLRDQGIDPNAARQVIRTRDELLRSANADRAAWQQVDDDDLLRLILLAYPDRVCRRRENPETATMVGGFGVKIAPTSVVTHAPLFIAVDARDDTRSNTRQALAYICSEVREEWLREMFPHMVLTTREVELDEASGKVQARIITRFADLPIHEQVDHQADSADIADALAAAARRNARAIFSSDRKAAQLLERLAFVRHHLPEKGFPEMDDDTLGEILARSCAGKRSLQQVKELDLAGLLLGELDWKLARELDELAPEYIQVPSGSRIRLEYSGEKQPTLSVRLQEIFSWQQTPRIAGGRVPLVLELLGPNFRPVQVTSDLASFWRTTYFQVRKDLRVRYPKHSWPEDPLTASPEAKGRRARN